MPVQLAIIFFFCLFLGKYMPLGFKELAYTISLAIKDILLFVLPFVIFSYLFSCILAFERGVLLFIVALVTAICASNFLSTLIAYSVGYLSLDSIRLMTEDAVHGMSLQPWFSLHLPKWIPNDKALLFGAVCGVIFAYGRVKRVERVALRMKQMAAFFLNKMFIPVVPLFLLGSVLAMEHDGRLQRIFKDYAPIVLLMLAVQFTYLMTLYAIAANFKVSRWLTLLKNVLPSGFTAFSTMSSAAAMPLILEGAEKNTHKPNWVKAVVPVAVNVHLIGDSIGIPLCALAILKTFGYGFPDFATYGVFALNFVLAKFAVAAVPGGGIIVMLPILKEYLGFSPEMLSLSFALYVLLDSFVTTVNTLGNGVFAILFTRVLSRIKKD